MLDSTCLRRAVRHEGGTHRRLFLAYGAALSAIPHVSQPGVKAETRVSFVVEAGQPGAKPA